MATKKSGIKKRVPKAATRRAAKLRAGATPKTVGTTKMVDRKGRVVLGGQFANRTVVIRKVNPHEILVSLARVIPEKESWIYENPNALKLIRTGLAQARQGQTADAPDVQGDEKFAGQLEDSGDDVSSGVDSGRSSRISKT